MMQSGYGVASEMQQFIVDGCPSSLFSPPTNANSQAAAADEIHAAQKFHPLSHPHQPSPPQFTHFGHPMLITQQLFQQTHHQFRLFHQQQQQQLGLEQESGPENSGGGPASFLAALNESSGGSRDGVNEDDGWHREEESAAANIKELSWRPMDIDFINKRPAKDKQPAGAAEISSNVKHFKKSNEGSHHNQTTSNNNQTDSNYKLFSELEAIYNPGSNPSGGSSGGGTNNQTGSGSALTGDDNSLTHTTAPGTTINNVSDTSNGGQAVLPLDKFRKGNRKLRKRRQQKQLSSLTTFFESLVKQLMDRQEGIHRKFLEEMARRDQERINREEAWRKQEAVRENREAAARAQERALTAAREAAVISFIEEITGERLNLPTKPQFQSKFTEESQQKVHDNNNILEAYNADSANNNSTGGIRLSSSRWPKAEVQALIRVRSGFETRFQEPGLKGSLWEEVSLAMAAMGYSRSAKRCKEKWENINKYFRKTKDSGKWRLQHSKTCPYFHQLAQLYSKSSSNANANANEREEEEKEDGEEEEEGKGESHEEA